LTQLNERRQPLVITQNGEAKAVVQDVATYEETQETLALLKILALGNTEIEAGKVKPVGEIIARLRARHAARQWLRHAGTRCCSPQGRTGSGVDLRELIAPGIRDSRQTAFKPYRVIYRVIGQKVYVYLIADGRRDMQSLLARRLLGT